MDELEHARVVREIAREGDRLRFLDSNGVVAEGRMEGLDQGEVILLSSGQKMRIVIGRISHVNGVPIAMCHALRTRSKNT